MSIIQPCDMYDVMSMIPRYDEYDERRVAMWWVCYDDVSVASLEAFRALNISNLEGPYRKIWLSMSMIKLYDEYLTAMWRVWYNLVRTMIKSCEEYDTVMWRAWYNYAKSMIQLCNGHDTVMWWVWYSYAMSMKKLDYDGTDFFHHPYQKCSLRLIIDSIMSFELDIRRFCHIKAQLCLLG